MNVFNLDREEIAKLANDLVKQITKAVNDLGGGDKMPKHVIFNKEKGTTVLVFEKEIFRDNATIVKTMEGQEFSYDSGFTIAMVKRFRPRKFRFIKEVTGSFEALIVAEFVDILHENFELSASEIKTLIDLDWNGIAEHFNLHVIYE